MDVSNFKFIFGIFLVDVVERIMMYDGIRLLVVFRECVDYVEKYGMKCEGIYRVLGIGDMRLIWWFLKINFIFIF